MHRSLLSLVLSRASVWIFSAEEHPANLYCCNNGTREAGYKKLSWSGVRRKRHYATNVECCQCHSVGRWTSSVMEYPIDSPAVTASSSPTRNECAV